MRTGQGKGTVAVVAATVVASGAHAQVSFTEIGLTHGIGSDSYITENNHGLGMNWIDFNLDGHPDLFAVNGLKADAHLYQNNGDGTFTKVDELLPVLPDHLQMASVFADYDRDGDLDLYVLTDNEDKDTAGVNLPDGPPNQLLKNLWVESGGTAVPLFEEVAAAAGVDDLAAVPFGDYPAYRSATGGFADFDRDGWVDIYVGHWVCQAGGDAANVDRVYHNNGDGTFTDVTAVCGIHEGTDPLYLRPALAIIACHLDGDLWPDIYVGNVVAPEPYHHDFYYQNNGDGTFTDVTALSPGIGDDALAAMGITVGDIDLDGDWDMYISNLFSEQHGTPPPGNPLYLGNGDGTFSDNVADLAGVQGDDSWGVNFLDLDFDGYEDLFVVTMGSAPTNNYLYMNQTDGTFIDIAPGSGIDVDGNGRGSAYADYDDDGDLDIAVSLKNDRLHLFRNDTPASNNWLMIELVGVRSNPDAIGALVRVTVGELVMMRQVIGGDSGHGQNPFALHFGLGQAKTVDHIEIFWPCGGVNHYHDVAPDQRVTYVEAFTPDVNGDEVVDVADLLDMLADWGPCSECPGCLADLDGDGEIGIGDLLGLLAEWG